MADMTTMTAADLDAALEKLAAFAETLPPGERTALNTVGALAVYGAEVAAATFTDDDDDEAEVEGFMIITGGRSGPGGGGSGGGSSSTFNIPAPPPPAGPGSIPVPYPNVSSTLGSRFPL